jgi:hypothetical protein
MGVDGGPVGDNVMADAMLGTPQRECGCDQLGSTLEELGELVLAGGGLDFGNAADVGGDFSDDAIDDGETFRTDESFVAEGDEETVGLEKVGPQDRSVYISDLESPRILVVFDFEGPVAGAIGLDFGAVGSDEVHAGWLGKVWTRGRHNADFRAGVDQEVRAGMGVIDME